MGEQRTASASVSVKLFRRYDDSDVQSPSPMAPHGTSTHPQNHSNPSGLNLPETFSKFQEPFTDNVNQSKGAPPSVKSSLSESMEPRPFRRWLSTLRRRRAQDPKTVVPRKERWTLDDFDTMPDKNELPRGSRHRKSNSHSSSLAFVTAVKSATATLASASIAAISSLGAGGSPGSDRDLLSPRHDLRPSIDGVLSAMDTSARLRSSKRREKLEELIRTEESYVADLKALSDVSTQLSPCISSTTS
jgi:hypothetical protein